MGFAIRISQVRDHPHLEDRIQAERGLDLDFVRIVQAHADGMRLCSEVRDGGTTVRDGWNGAAEVEWW